MCRKPTMSNADESRQRRVLLLALVLNAAMFAVGITAGVRARSTGLIADSLDMFADAIAYGIALAAMRRGAAFRAQAAAVSGSLLLLLGTGVLAEAVHRVLKQSLPQTGTMLAVGTLSLIVNATVLSLLGKTRRDAVHMQATWIFTRADVIANLAVLLSALIIAVTRFTLLDPIVGFGIGLYIIKEAVEILWRSRST